MPKTRFLERVSWALRLNMIIDVICDANTFNTLSALFLIQWSNTYGT